MPIPETTDARRADVLRRVARAKDLRLVKSRVRAPHAHDLGGYMLVDADRNWVVCGEDFSMDLDEVEQFLISY